MKLGGSASTPSSALLAWVPADAVAEYLSSYRTRTGEPVNLAKVVEWLEDSGQMKNVRDPLSLRKVMGKVIRDAGLVPAFDDGKAETNPHVSILIEVMGGG